MLDNDSMHSHQFQTGALPADRWTLHLHPIHHKSELYQYKFIIKQPSTTVMNSIHSILSHQPNVSCPALTFAQSCFNCKQVNGPLRTCTRGSCSRLQSIFQLFVPLTVTTSIHSTIHKLINQMSSMHAFMTPTTPDRPFQPSWLPPTHLFIHPSIHRIVTQFSYRPIKLSF